MPDALTVIESAFADIWSSLLLFLPRFLGAIVVFILGLIVASLLRKLVMKVSDLIRLDLLAEKLDLKKSFAQMGVKLNVAAVLGWIVKWFFIIVFLVAATDILGWSEITVYLREVVSYLPNVIIAVIILLAGLLIANFTRNVIQSTVKAAKIQSAQFLAGLSKWAILIFSFMAALVQLQIAQDLIRILFTGLVAMLAIAGGLAFGLGGKEEASRVLSKLRKDLSE